MTRRVEWAVVLLALCGLASAEAAAQQRPPLRENVDRVQLEERVREQMGRLMRERLGLDQEEADRLSEVVRGFDGRRRELFVEEQAARRRVEALLGAGSDDEGEARELITRMWELREEEAELFREEQEALLDVLTPTQVLRLQELRQDLGRRIRALDGGRGGRPGVAPGGGSPRQELRLRGGRRGAVRLPAPGTQPVL